MKSWESIMNLQFVGNFPNLGLYSSKKEKMNNIKIEIGCKNISLILLLSKLYIPLFLSDILIKKEALENSYFGLFFCPTC